MGNIYIKNERYVVLIPKLDLIVEVFANNKLSLIAIIEQQFKVQDFQVFTDEAVCLISDEDIDFRIRSADYFRTFKLK